MYENLSDPMPLKKEIKLYTGTGNPALSEYKGEEKTLHDGN